MSDENSIWLCYKNSTPQQCCHKRIHEQCMGKQQYRLHHRKYTEVILVHDLRGKLTDAPVHLSALRVVTGLVGGMR